LIREELFQIVLPMLDKELEGKQFIAGTAMTVVDVGYFMELQQIHLVTSQP
jgi:hypothetical protein